MQAGAKMQGGTVLLRVHASERPHKHVPACMHELMHAKWRRPWEQKVALLPDPPFSMESV
eukprot:357494-Chlamydomonas_euryale.AAC.1